MNPTSVDREASTVDAFIPVLWACSKNKDLSRGMSIHFDLQRRGLAEKTCSDALVTMYAKCGELQRARALLDQYNSSNTIPWTALIASYTRAGQSQKALDCFDQMRKKGVAPDVVTYSCILKSCGLTKDIEKGSQLHQEILQQGLRDHSSMLDTALVDMYAKCGALSQAESVLKGLVSRNVICWSALMAGYAQHGQGQQVLDCYDQMQLEGIIPNSITFLSVLKACSIIGDLEKAKQTHHEILKRGLLTQDVLLGSAIVDMYAKCGDFFLARSALEGLSSRTVVSWCALITGYVEHGQGYEALKCFEQMQDEGIPLDATVYVCALKACAQIGAIEKGKKIHEEILRQELFKHDRKLGNALVDMYAKCGHLRQAKRVLNTLGSGDVVSWSALITGYIKKGKGKQALECFKRMKCAGIHPNAVTYICILKACALARAVDEGKKIHDEVSRKGLLENDRALGGALVDMYAKCGALQQAQSLMEELPHRDVITWTALIAGHAQEGQAEQAFKCFEQMLLEGIRPNVVTFLCLLKLCNHLGLVEKGQELFDSLRTIHGLKPTMDCLTCVIDLLGRAGCLEKAVEIIQKMPFPANSATWLCLLCACRKWVDVEVGIWAFEQAIELDKCDSSAYVLMVNIYEAAGMLEQAKDIEALRVKNKIWKQVGFSTWTDSVNGANTNFCNGRQHLDKYLVSL